MHKNSEDLVVQTPFEGGGTILKWVSFVQLIVTDWYIHRRELSMVSLKSPSTGENGAKKIFSDFVF